MREGKKRQREGERENERKREEGNTGNKERMEV